MVLTWIRKLGTFVFNRNYCSNTHFFSRAQNLPYMLWEFVPRHCSLVYSKSTVSRPAWLGVGVTSSYGREYFSWQLTCESATIALC